MASKKSAGAFGFDPSGLERAAKAAKDIDSSPNAKLAFELAVKQEETKKQEAVSQVKQMDIQRAQIEQQEKRKTLQHELETAKQKSQFDDGLARRRYEEQLEQHAAQQEQNRQRDEQSVAKQEQLKRQTMQYEHQLRREADQAQLLTKEKAKIERMHSTKELRHEDIRVRESERRLTKQDLWTKNLEIVGSGIKSYVSDIGNLATLAGGLTLAFFGFQFARTSGRFVSKIVESRFGRPSLVRETSRKSSFKDWAFAPFGFFYSQVLVKGRIKNTSAMKQKDVLEGIIIEENLEKSLRQISHSIINRKKHYAPFRNLLLHGPPGTGKTLFAKSLAMHSGMDYAILTGGDISPLGREAVNELHKLFDWSITSSRGVLLFIDEADAFLRKRASDEYISEDLRNAINAFLYRTGTASHNFMVVMASNTPEQLDRAIHDRLDEMIHFDRPGEKQRLQMIYHYLIKYCQPVTAFKDKFKRIVDYPRTLLYKKTEIGMAGIENHHIEGVAKKTEGFSGRELYKMVIAWHDAAFNQENAILTPELLYSILDEHIEQHKQRIEWEEFKNYADNNLQKDSDEQAKLGNQDKQDNFY